MGAGAALLGDALVVTTVSRTVQVPPETVFETLADGWLYALWVVGASHIRGVDPGWPAVGTRIHHSVGAWPALVQDNTEVIEADPPRRLALTARAWPFGTARVVLTLEPAAGGTTIVMEEEPTAGPGRWVHNPVNEKLLHARNIESLDRLASVVEGRR